MKKFMIVLMFALMFFVTACSEEEETKFTLNITNSVNDGTNDCFINFFEATLDSKDIFGPLTGMTPSILTPFPLTPNFNIAISLDAGVFDATWVFCGPGDVDGNNVCISNLQPTSSGTTTSYTFKAGKSYTLTFQYSSPYYTITEN